MYKILLSAWIWCLCLLAQAQVITISDQETGTPLEAVVLVSQEPEGFAVTNKNGEVDISEFRGAKEIQVRVLNYKIQVVSYQNLQASASLSLQSVGIALDELVIAATRWNQVSSDIPQKVTGISPKKIAFQNPQTSADMLALSGKVFIQKSQQGGGSPMIRGFATNRLLYTVDGVRMNTAIFRGGNIQNVISLDAFTMERTEIFFGPGSVVYGSDAIGGVMSFQTLTPALSLEDKSKFSGNAVTRYSSANNEQTGHVDFNIGLKKWAFVSSFTHTDYDDLRMGSHGPKEYLRPFYVERKNGADVIVDNDDPRIQTPSGYTQYNVMQKVRFKPSAKWGFQYGFHYSETSPYARYDRHIRYKNGLPRYGEWSYGPQLWMMNNLNITHSNKTVLFDQMTLRLAKQRFEESRISRNIDTPNRETREELVDAYSVNVDFAKSMNRHKLYYGVEWVSNDVTSTGRDENIDTGVRMPGPSRYPQANWSSYGIYVTDQIKLSESLLLSTGIRYNQFVLDATFVNTFYPFPFETASLNKGALTGSLGLVYRPSEDWVLSTNMATAMRAPNVDDIGKVFDSEPGAVVIPNPNLKPEQAYNIDFGAAHVFGDVARLDVSVYYTLLDDALVRRDFLLNGEDSIQYDGELSKVQAIQNAARATVYGIQAGIEIRLSSTLRFSSDVNIQKGEEETDDGTTSPSRHAPPWFGVTRLTYRAKKWQVELNAQYSGGVSFARLPIEEQGKPEIYAVNDNGNPYSPSWFVLNLKGQYTLTNYLTLNAGLENITDRRYRPYSSGIVAAGRNVMIGLRGRF
jgi:hemoglobin/transferrin/lactoferrin receptor protein